VYSFSLVLWEIVNQTIPFHNANTNSVNTKVLNGEHPQPEKTNGTPVEYQEIMEKGWDLDPRQRPSAKEMLDVFGGLESAEWFGHRIPRIGDDDDEVFNSQPNFEIPLFSPLDSKIINYPITRLADLKTIKISCTEVLKLFEDAKNNRDLFDKSVKIINSGIYMFNEIQKIIDQSTNPYWKNYIEDSPIFQEYSNYLLNVKNVNAFVEDDNVKVHIILIILFMTYG